jgi:hypothetical protein
LAVALQASGDLSQAVALLKQGLDGLVASPAPDDSVREELLRTFGEMLMENTQIRAKRSRVSRIARVVDSAYWAIIVNELAWLLTEDDARLEPDHKIIRKYACRPILGYGMRLLNRLKRPSNHERRRTEHLCLPSLVFRRILVASSSEGLPNGRHRSLRISEFLAFA